MNLLKEIYQKDLGIFEGPKHAISYKVRKASRAIVIHNSGNIALMYVSKDRYHKLPGGGIEAGEDKISALRRELLEEAGVHIDVQSISELGVIIEYRDRHELLQISYGFCCKTTGENALPAFTQEEIAEGFQLKWVSLDDAVSLCENDRPDNYLGKFILSRDLEFLKKAFANEKGAAI